MVRTSSLSNLWCRPLLLDLKRIKSRELKQGTLKKEILNSYCQYIQLDRPSRRKNSNPERTRRRQWTQGHLCLWSSFQWELLRVAKSTSYSRDWPGGIGVERDPRREKSRVINKISQPNLNTLERRNRGVTGGAPAWRMPKICPAPQGNPSEQYPARPNPREQKRLHN